jgi:hypothetical protein
MYKVWEMSYKDKSYCASPACENKCGRKLSEQDRKFIAGHPWMPVSYAYFCGEPVEDTPQSNPKPSKPL